MLGTPGSGKSFSAKREITNAFLVTNDDILVCDPESEYFSLVKRLNGEVLKISPTSKQYINPMDINLNYSEDDNPVALKSDFILSLCELIVGGKNGLEAIEKTIIDRCVRNVYRDYLNNPNEKEMPILEDLYNELKNQNEKEAIMIATSLEIYVSDSLNVFNHRTNVNTNNRIICYDIKELDIHHLDNRKEQPTGICINYTGTAKTKGRNEIVTDDIYCGSAHRIEVAKIMDLLQITLRNLIEYVLNNKEKFVAMVQESLEMEKTKDFEKQKKKIPVHKKRLKELDILLDKIYEDNALGKIDEERYQARYEKYIEEHYRLKEELSAIETIVGGFANNSDRVHKFIQIVEKYATFEDISQTRINEFVSRIVVHDHEDKGCRNSPQRIELHFNYIGEFKSAEPHQEDFAKWEEERTRREHRREIQKRHREKKKQQALLSENKQGFGEGALVANG